MINFIPIWSSILQQRSSIEIVSDSEFVTYYIYLYEFRMLIQNNLVPLSQREYCTIV